MKAKFHIRMCWGFMEIGRFTRTEEDMISRPWKSPDRSTQILRQFDSLEEVLDYLRLQPKTEEITRDVIRQWL